MSPPTRRAAGECLIGALPGDAVCCETLLRLEPRERPGGRSSEPAVDGGRVEPVRDQPELERGDIPADGTDRELALPEQRPAERPECRARLALDTPGDRESLDPLQIGQPRRRQRPLDAVDGRRIEPVGVERNLEGGDAGAAGGAGWPAQREGTENSGREDEQAAHSPSVGRAPDGLKRC